MYTPTSTDWLQATRGGELDARTDEVADGVRYALAALDLSDVEPPPFDSHGPGRHTWPRPALGF